MSASNAGKLSRRSFLGSAAAFPVVISSTALAAGETPGANDRIGIGLIGSVLQREVFVSTMGTIFNISDTAEDEGSLSLRERMVHDIDPATGARSFSMLTAICLMVWYALSMQCMSTVAIMKRETNGWKWPLIQIGYMTALAYGVTWSVFRVGQMIGLG